jgi:arginyl-tRNA synthetase
MRQEVVEVVQKAIQSLMQKWGLGALPEIEVEIPRNESLGDVATTVAMDLSRTLKRPPREIAEEIYLVIRLEEYNSGKDSLFEKIETAGPGFINFTYQKRYFYENLEKLLIEEHASFRTDIGKGKTIQIEFVSANPTGPLHIGHGRGAAVGHALSNLLKTAGFEVQREYYINDAGLQVKLLGQSVYARYQQILGNAVPFPEEGYRGDYIEDISREIIKKADKKYLHQLYEKCRDFFTNYAYKMMLADIAKDLRDFGIIFDRWQSERELHEKGKIKNSLNTLQKTNFLYKREGALWFASKRFKDDKDRVVIKKDGEYTYFASDIAYHKDKLDRGFDVLINIWGADHHGYIQRIRSVLEAFGLQKERFRVILVQMVSLFRQGKPVQMSKRAGEFITLREVIDEVGADTAKFIFLTRRPDSHLDFDLAVAKEQSAENPVFYVQYAFARISSIFRQAMNRNGTWQAAEKKVLSSESEIKTVDLTMLKEDEELSLMKKLLQYQLVFEGAVFSCEPHRITYYLQELAKMFHSYYNRHRVISEDPKLSSARLCLCKAVQIVLEDGLNILGVSAPERM